VTETLYHHKIKGGWRRLKELVIIWRMMSELPGRPCPFFDIDDMIGAHSWLYATQRVLLHQNR
jgi:hypothetical protein